jgi:hypothetical protein
LEIRGVLDDAKQAFVWTFADGDCLANGTISSIGFGRCHHRISICSPVSLQSGIHTGKIWSGSPATFGGHSSHVGSSDDKDARILCLLAIVKKQERAVDMNDNTLLCLTADFFDRIILSNFRSVPICGHGVTTSFDFI